MSAGRRRRREREAHPARPRRGFLAWRLPWLLAAVGLLGPAGAGLITEPGFSGTMWTIAMLWIGVASLVVAWRTRRLSQILQGPVFLAFGALAAAETGGQVSLGWAPIWVGLGITTVLANLPEVIGQSRRGSSGGSSTASRDRE